MIGTEKKPKVWALRLFSLFFHGWKQPKSTFLKSPALCVTLWQDFPCTNSSLGVSSVLPNFLTPQHKPCWILPGIISKMQVYEIAGKKQWLMKLHFPNPASAVVSQWSWWKLREGIFLSALIWGAPFRKERTFLGKLLLMGNAVISVALLLTQYWGQIKEMEVLVWE